MYDSTFEESGEDKLQRVTNDYLNKQICSSIST